MTETEDTETPEAEQAPAPEEPVRKTAGQERAEKDRLKLQERIAREIEDEVTVAFDAHAELYKSLQSAVRAVDVALGLAAALERKCSSPVGRRLFLARRLALKPLLGVLGTSLHHLKKAISGMNAVARTRESLIEEAAGHGLDH